ncbi:MAG: 9-O-acetylesterase [Lysobacteraceae bacterium]|nr:MAG: 9-O-acetylesterase [Xanthomonadaceae bacterium]
MRDAWLVGACLILPALALAQEAGGSNLLDPMFQDHAVLQRDQPIRLWGNATAGGDIQVQLNGRKSNARADQNGKWEVQLPAMAAGGPHVLIVSDGARTQSVSDLLVGDVWLCSGQSNMELPVWRALDASSELANPSAPTIRLLTIPQVASVIPLDKLPPSAQWQQVNAGTLREFSATCFFFARELQKSIDVPMGLIDASWGGSRIEAWIGADALRSDPRFEDPLAVLDLYHGDPLAATQRWGEVWGKWWDQRPGTVPGDRPWNPADASTGGWRAAPSALGPWEQWNEPALADFNGMVWFRTEVALSAAQAGQGATLELGALDETDVTWVNGRAIGSRYDPGSPRSYRLPVGLLQEGANRIVVNVLDTYREGGMNAPASAYRLKFDVGTAVPLVGWQYRMAVEGPWPPSAPWQSAGGTTTLYNGMIAPLGRYGLRGMLWYQGESNTGAAGDYGDLLRRLGAGWRARFGDALPILVVQLAGYGVPSTAPVESGWAGVREAQRRVAASDPNTALAVALDIGDRYDIHPPNKQEVGRRLARAARAQVYGQALSASGPVPASARRERDAVAVRFTDVDGGLVAYGAEGPVGFELCGDAEASCRYATAQIAGQQVLLRGDGEGNATRVRYGWADNPVITLFDRAGLPAGPFEIAIEP